MAQIGRRHYRWRLRSLVEQTKSQTIQPSLRRWSRTNSKHSVTGWHPDFRRPIRSSSARKWYSSRRYLHSWTVYASSGYFTTERRRISCFGCTDAIDSDCDSRKSVWTVLTSKMIVVIESVEIGKAALEARFLGRLTQPSKHWYVYSRAYLYIQYTHGPPWLILCFFSLLEEDQLSNCLDISLSRTFKNVWLETW